jgi:thiol-disulfide isomerase/thioredoxin
MKIIRVLWVVLTVFPSVLMGQQVTPIPSTPVPTIGGETTTRIVDLAPPPTSLPPAELELNQVMADANGSAVDVIRGLEAYLRKYPDTERRVDLEATIYKYSIDLGDKPRMILYGEKMVTNNSGDPIEILDRTLHALLASDDAEAAKKALGYARQYEAAVAEKKARDPEGHATAAQWENLADHATARAMVLEARALGNLGNMEEAVAVAKKSWSLSPSAEGAQEMGRWLRKLGREAEAIDCYADATMIEDTTFPWIARDDDRKLAGELYVKVHGNDQGLGDVFLRAWDRSAAAVAARTARYQAMDSNFGQTDPYQYKLPELDANAATGGPLDMAKLKGKTLVIDFWATWCGPCVAQHPMIEEVRRKYAASPDVVFLSIDSDDDRTLVKPFLEAQKWTQRVYHEGGLGGLLNVAALPTLLVIDPAGKAVTRMTGFNPDSFESALGARIDEARAVKAR